MALVEVCSLTVLLGDNVVAQMSQMPHHFTKFNKSLWCLLGKHVCSVLEYSELSCISLLLSILSNLPGPLWDSISFAIWKQTTNTAIVYGSLTSMPTLNTSLLNIFFPASDLSAVTASMVMYYNSVRFHTIIISLSWRLWPFPWVVS